MKRSTWVLFILLPLLSLLGFQAKATHIVGGELTLRHVNGDRFVLRMTLYFDVINGSIGALDQQAQLRIFRKRDNLYMRGEVMTLQSRTPVQYSNPECALTPDGVQTDQLVYEKEVRLPVNDFSDEGGYYVTWDRCCRNGVIGNIVEPGNTGQLFYLEFPGRRFQGQPFENSSPTLFRPLSDFACRNVPFSFNFSGEDIDGDSLAYSLTRPLAGNSSAINVGQYPADTLDVIPRPYPAVTWESGFSDNLQVQGTPPLNIDARTGILTMNPNRVGLFVFAIECREYRNGRQIGLVRRDFQILVKDCAPNSPPRVRSFDPFGQAIAPGDTVTLDFENNTACLPITVSDSLPDRLTVTLSAPALRTYGTFRDTVGTTTPTRRFFTTRFCLNSCALFAPSIVARVVIRVRDNACSVPATDSLPFFIRIQGRQLSGISLSSPRYADGDTLLLDIGQTFIPLTLVDSFPSLAATPPQAQVQPALPPGSSLSVQATTVPGILQGFNGRIVLPCTIDTNRFYTIRYISARPYCGNPRIDTFTVVFRARRTPIRPLLTLLDTVNPVTQGQEFRLRPSQPLPLLLRGRSSDDSTEISLSYRSSTPITPAFTPRQGPSPQEALWTWTPPCDRLTPDNAPIEALFRATLQDCGRVLSDSVAVRIFVADTSGGQPRLANIVTLNNDQANERLDWQLPAPVDNCAGGFERLDIYNRWGKAVFSTTRRDFVWPPASMPAGTYFVAFRFAGKKYSQWVEVVRP